MLQKLPAGVGVSMVVPSQYRTKVRHLMQPSMKGGFIHQWLSLQHFFVFKYDDENHINRIGDRMCCGATSDSECCILMQLKASFFPFLKYRIRTSFCQRG